EVIDHGETGYIAELGNVDQVAYFALKMLTDDELMDRLSVNAKQVVETKFASGTILNQYEELYDRVLNND
ncbi:MAG: N-acetyl-alpha-D-glucosaminyl L-malate synthase BshA, partial [Halobacillus sp.]